MSPLLFVVAIWGGLAVGYAGASVGALICGQRPLGGLPAMGVVAAASVALASYAVMAA